MNHTDVPTVLNQLLRPLARSLPRYLEFAQPWPVRRQGGPRCMARLVADQRAYALLVSEAVFEYGGRPDPGPFPIEFAGHPQPGVGVRAGPGRRRPPHRVDAIEWCSGQLESFPRYGPWPTRFWTTPASTLRSLRGSCAAVLARGPGAMATLAWPC